VQDSPCSLSCADECAARNSRRYEPHVAPLNELVDRIRKERGPDCHIPYFDPCDGGIHAGILILMEAPGPKAAGQNTGGSGFVTRNNPDASASNLCKICHYVFGDVRSTIGSQIYLFLRHVTDNDRAGSKFSEFLQVLPSLSRRQVQRLIDELRSEGRVRVEGRTNAAKWFVE